MGKQAKFKARRRHEALAKAIIEQSSRWARPALPREREWYDEVASLPHELVVTQRREVLIRGGMIPNDCHINCASQEQNDPTRAAKHVFGWWQHGQTYVLHSVIEQNGALYCITPQHYDVPAFMFVRDPKLRWGRVGGKQVIVREGAEPPIGLRKDPDRFIRAHSLLMEKIGEGLDPIAAMEAVDAEIGLP